MTSPMTRVEILNAVFGHLPDREVELLRSLPLNDPLTYVRVCGAVREHRVALPRDVSRDLLTCLDEVLAAGFEAAPAAAVGE